MRQEKLFVSRTPKVITHRAAIPIPKTVPKPKILIPKIEHGHFNEAGLTGLGDPKNFSQKMSLGSADPKNGTNVNFWDWDLVLGDGVCCVVTHILPFSMVLHSLL